VGVGVVVEPSATIAELPAFVRHRAGGGSRIVASVAPAQAGDAVEWAEGLRRAGRIEEFGLTPATLEDVYVELVGRADALRESNETEATDDRAA
jgi:hypothetical protein